MPPSDGTFSNEFTKRDLEKSTLEAQMHVLIQMEKVTPLVIAPDPKPIVPLWLYDLMQEMDDG